MLQTIFFTALLLGICILLRNAVAYPIGVVMEAYGADDAHSRARKYVAITFRVIVSILLLIAIIAISKYSFPMFGNLFGVWGDFFSSLLKAI